MERYVVNRHSKKRKSNDGLLLKWRKKYNNLRKRSWVTNGYDLNNAGYVINRRYTKSKMSPVCHSFVQNAWKKDFCSNCFKSREEHVKQEKTTEGSKYTATPFQNRSTFFKKTPPSILKITPKKKNKRNVRFPEEVCSVIGFGGDDWSDEEEFEMSEENDDEDVFPDTEEERELYKITKTNTDFNTVKANLLGDSVAKSYTSLLLGKMQTDSDGKKKTLMVSVTPFGQENKGPNIKTHTRKPAVIHINETQTEEAANNYKTNIILTSYIKESETIIASESVRSTEGICTEKSLLEEISETLQQNRMSTTELSLNHKDNNKPTVIEEKRKESMQDEVEKKEMTESRKNGIVRKSPLIKTQERPKVNLSRSEFKFCKINIESSSVDSAVGTLNSTANNSLTSDDDSFSARTDSDNDDSGHFSETHKCEETVKIKVFNESEKTMKMSPIGHLRKADGKAGSGYSTFQTPIIDMPPIIPKQPDTVFSAEASRELAGEPDGRADPDEPSEAPALPSSPIPTMDPRPSFLHGMITDIMPSKPTVPEKPKVPTKPVIKQTTKKSVTSSHQIMQMHSTKKDEVNKHVNEEKHNGSEIHEQKTESIYYAKPVLTKQDSDVSLNSLSKRKAPTPPLSPTEEFPNNLYQRNPSGYMKSDSPVVREMEKRERAVMSTPKTRTVEDIDKKDLQPEPAPRRSISLSHDNLLLDEKRKGKYKFSIKKLLRIGSSKDLDKKEISVATVTKVSPHKTEEIYDLAPKPKPRLVIIHPLDINGSNVEVVKSNCEISESLRRMSHDDVSIYSGSSSATDVEPPKIVNKPPPPPRLSSEDASATPVPTPARPPPPKSAALQKKQKQQTWTPAINKPDSIYANLGEIRSALAPRKPERTASMRERESHLELLKRRTPLDDDKDESDEPQELVQATNDTVINNYDDVYNSGKYDEETCDSAKNSDSDYEYVHHARSSSPECDAAIKPREVKIDIRSDTKNEDSNTEYPKYNNSFNRSSIPYCGSETESEIYSPYSFYSSNDNMDGSTNDDYQNEMTPKTTTNKLRVRKGRSIVHKNLEDNYGAVVIANHEALAQVLEQVQQSATMQSSLRGLKACTNLRWSDFTIQSQSKGLTAGKRVFHSAVWNSNQGPVQVTLMLYKEQLASQLVCQQSLQPTLSLNAVTEFCDLVPMQQFGEEGEDLVQATIVVLGHAQVDTLQSYGESLHSGEGHSKDHQLVSTEQTHEAIFMLLQLINGLKCLQARGVEEISEALTSFISLKEVQPLTSHSSTLNLPSPDDRLNSLWAPKTNSYGRLCVLQGLSDEINSSKSNEDEHHSSLCKCAIRAVDILLPGEKLTPVLKEVLQEERAVSLNQAKSVLEFMLWGPLDVVQGVPVEERELSLQRWLDLERATVLHGLVRTRVQLNVFEQLHLMFLVRSTAKAMCDASVLLEKANVY
ncbi:PREDICTED: uncharacterized protein LOC106103994 isoform X1 [Papilio polytes]|uniref:uncharacterized protein LOC106103994 isoform X1 n=2 Tax=Papilio polytes TaxID=76194 RepID=UPI000675F35B|nr:PREDICTED: uncharacterized protein LOC106103994 isoform X1 [Papilio polytes]